MTYSTKPRGGVVHTLALAEALAQRGHDVTVWSIARGGDVSFFRRVDPRVNIRLVGFVDVEGESVGQRVLRSIEVLAAAIDRAPRYDVVHAQDCITANAAGPGCVRTVHHLDTFTTPELIACHDRALRHPRAFVCVSAAVAGELALDRGLEAVVIPNGVDSARFAAAAAELPDAVAARASWRMRIGGPYLLAVGGIEPRKGTADLIEAMGLLTADRLTAGLPMLPLVIAGGETLFDYRDYRAAVLARAGELRVPLQILGPVLDDRLPALVAGASVFAFPSTQEGFGLAAMEALAAGVPLVCRDLPVLREVFGGAAAFASTPVELANSLAEAVAGADPVVAGAGRALAARHTWAAAALAHEALYLSLPG